MFAESKVTRHFLSGNMLTGCNLACVCLRREANRKASERLKQKQKARLVDLEGRCTELEAANTMARQQVTSLLSGCQFVLQQHVLLLQQLRHVLGGVQHRPAAGAAAATQVANMLAQQPALGAASDAVLPVLLLPRGGPAGYGGHPSGRYSGC